MSYTLECKTPQALLDKCRRQYSGVYMKVQSRSSDHAWWNKKGAWITIKTDENKDHFYQMSEETFNKIKDNLVVNVVKKGETA